MVYLAEPNLREIVEHTTRKLTKRNLFQHKNSQTLIIIITYLDTIRISCRINRGRYRKLRHQKNYRRERTILIKNNPNLKNPNQQKINKPNYKQNLVKIIRVYQHKIS